MTVYDVIVIGAGPAGGSCALHSARGGLKTLIIEDHEKIGEPVHCGECLSEYATINTGIKPPESVISKHVNGIRVIFPGGTESILNQKGFVLEKHKFEQWLTGEAIKEGARLKLGTRLEELERKNNLWEVKTNKEILKSKIVIDATGVASIVSRKLELNKRFESVTGIQYELKGIPEKGYIDFYIWPKLAPNGYLWMIPKSNGRANVGLVTNERNKAKINTDLFVEKMKWGKKEKVKTFGGLIPASGPLEKTFDEGLMIIGDAAGFTSPLFEGGTHLSLKSGEMSAQVAKEAIRKNDFSKEMFSKYQEKWKQEFPKYEKLLKGKKALYGFTDEELNFIANELPRTFDDFGFLQKASFGLRILFKKPGLLKKHFVSAMKALEYSNAEFYGW